MSKPTYLTKTQPWTEKNGKVLSITGKWWTRKQLIRAVQRILTKLPEQYDQVNTVCFINSQGYSGYKNEACGANACLAGWMGLLTTGRENSFQEIGRFLTNGRTSFLQMFDGNWHGDPTTKIGREWNRLQARYNNAMRAGSVRRRANCGIKALELFMKEEGI